jgi:hypothetical protein
MMILHSKASGDGGDSFQSRNPSGGGGGGYSLRKPSKILLETRANLVLYVDRKDGVYIHKNRYDGKTGKVNTTELVNILCHILSEHIFNGSIKLFQEGMRLRLKKAINRIIEKG